MKANFIERSLAGVLSFLRDSIFSEEYAAKKGLLQALDPRFKLLAFAFFLLSVLFSRSFYFLVGMYVFCLVLAFLSSIRLGFFLKRTWVFIPLFSLCIALPALFSAFTPGEAVARLKIFFVSLTVTRQGIASAGFFFARVLTSVSLSILLVLTTRHYVLLKVLRIFGVPQVFVMTLGMCYRYAHFFVGLLQNTCLALKSRVGSVSSLKKGQQVVAWNISSLWQRSYQLNEEVYKAMLSRGYMGEPVVLSELRVKPTDWLWLAVAGLVSVLAFYV